MIVLPYDANDLDVATRTLCGEADGEPVTGQYRVAFTMRNRSDWGPLEDGHPEQEWWGNSVAQCCEAKYQYSCWLPGPDCDRINALSSSSPDYAKLSAICADVFNGTADESLSVDSAGNYLTHYKVTGTRAMWDGEANAKNLVPVIDGKHSFYALGAH